MDVASTGASALFEVTREGGARLAVKEAAEAQGRREIGEAIVPGETYDLTALAEVEGWSVEGLMDSADAVLGVENLETEALRNHRGEIVEWVRPEEKAHYDTIGLEPAEVNGRDCLVRDDIDWDQLNYDGRSNLDWALDGRAPLDPDGESYELHHVQQRDDGVLAELTQDEHRGEIDSILHDKEGPSEIDREHFGQVVRPEHWQTRAQGVLEERGLA